MDVYILIRFILMSCSVGIVHDTHLFKDYPIDPEELMIYKITHPFDKEEEFKNINDGKIHNLFHGSKWQNWYSILRNGLKNCSNTKMMMHGAATGPGIYTSDLFSVPYQYGLMGKKCVVGVFELADDPAKYKTSPNIFVINKENVLIQRYLIIHKIGKGTKKNSSNLTNCINKVFSQDVHSEKAKIETFVMTKGVKKIVREYKMITKDNPEKKGFRIEVTGNNLYVWHVYLFNFGANELITEDMNKYGIKEIELEIKFPENYPMSPPFVRIIRPRFMTQTAHVTSGGSICNQLLTEKFWSPACTIESLVTTIRAEMLEGGAKLDPTNLNIPYGEKEARESFIRVAAGHKWL